jgi:hypothetical protein
MVLTIRGKIKTFGRSKRKMTKKAGGGVGMFRSYHTTDILQAQTTVIVT